MGLLGREIKLEEEFSLKKERKTRGQRARHGGNRKVGHTEGKQAPRQNVDEEKTV